MASFVRLVRFVAGSLVLLVWTWLWFLPVGGFHHMFRCGLLGWAIIDEENGPTEIRWSLPLLLVSLVVWGIPVALRWWLKRMPSAGDAEVR